MTIPENQTQVTLPPLPYAKKDSALAIISLVSGLVAWTFMPIVGAIAAIITGHLAKKEIRDSGNSLNGNGMALAGLILGYVQLGLILLGIILVTVLVIVFGSNLDLNNGFNSFTSLIPNLI
jgi:hypothetical protein